MQNAEDPPVIALKKKLVDILLTALEKKEIQLDHSRSAANYILDNIQNDAGKETIIAFLSDLAEKWPIFKDTLTIYKGEEAGSKINEEQEVISKLENYIKTSI